jgi:hypothetical protein
LPRRGIYWAGYSELFVKERIERAKREADEAERLLKQVESAKKMTVKLNLLIPIPISKFIHKFALELKKY